MMVVIQSHSDLFLDFVGNTKIALHSSMFVMAMYVSPPITHVGNGAVVSVSHHLLVDVVAIMVLVLRVLVVFVFGRWDCVCMVIKGWRLLLVYCGELEVKVLLWLLDDWFLRVLFVCNGWCMG